MTKVTCWTSRNLDFFLCPRDLGPDIWRDNMSREHVLEPLYLWPRTMTLSTKLTFCPVWFPSFSVHVCALAVRIKSYLVDLDLLVHFHVRSCSDNHNWTLSQFQTLPFVVSCEAGQTSHRLINLTCCVLFVRIIVRSWHKTVEHMNNTVEHINKTFEREQSNTC